MTEHKDYNNYDYIEIIVKMDSAEEVINAYSGFLWQEIERRQDRRYSDLIHVVFCREHKIANKDRLQLLQVHYENALNDKAQAFKSKHNNTMIFFSNLMVLMLAILALAGAFILYIGKTWSIILGVAIFLSSIVAIIFLLKYLKKRFKVDKQKYLDKATEFDGQIKDIMQEVNFLTGGEVYEK